MKIYLDNDFKCYLTNDGARKEIDTVFFDGKCEDFINGYRYVPYGSEWINPNGEKFIGLMIAPWKDIDVLAAIQNDYDRYVQAIKDGVNNV